jgi:pyruvate formate lyase activating enzyme
MHEAALYEKLPDLAVRCSVCNNRCTIREGKTGICSVRVNKNGVLYSTTYGLVTSEAIDPIEKKPLYHFLPGSRCYSLGGIGCNFHCEHCQNWHISRATGDMVRMTQLTPADGIEHAVRQGCRSIAWTYNEPTIWHEYTRDMALLARVKGLGTVYVTNGYITEEALRDISPVLNAFRVDIKSFSDDFYRKICGGRLEPVLNSTCLARELGLHVEVVTLIIPGLNDNPVEVDSLIKWVIDNPGPATPVHFTRFHPDYHMTDRAATPVPALEKIYRRAKELGLRFPYLGNVPLHPFENTYCPNCGELLIERTGYEIKMISPDIHKCGNCGEGIEIVTDVGKKQA